MNTISMLNRLKNSHEGKSRLGTLVTNIVVVVGSSVLMVSVAWGELPSPESHQQGSGGSTSGATLQVASLLGTIPYGAAKMGLALFGGLAGATGYALSGDLEGASEIWKMTMQGTYVLSPDHLTGEKPIRFFIEPDDTGSEE